MTKDRGNVEKISPLNIEGKTGNRVCTWYYGIPFRGIWLGSHSIQTQKAKRRNTPYLEE
jgi:hypothetical protein